MPSINMLSTPVTINKLNEHIISASNTSFPGSNSGYEKVHMKRQIRSYDMLISTVMYITLSKKIQDGHQYITSCPRAASSSITFLIII